MKSSDFAGRVTASLRGLFWLVVVCQFVLVAPCQQTSDQPLPGSIAGTVVDGSGAPITGAKVKLSRQDGSAAQEGLSSADGAFAFDKVIPGPYRLAVQATGFAPQTSSGILRAGEISSLITIVLPVATLNTDVEVTLPRVDIAEAEIKSEEKQRLIGLAPNFLVSYIPNAVPLTTKQKFELSWKTAFDPFSFGITAIIAGVQQSRNSYSGYGQGVEGYANRFGAAYGNFFTGTMISSAILPALLRQDPRYFVKGTGSKRSRFFYAVANAFVRKGDNGRWQPDYSDILGGLASGGISNLYYPAKNRDGMSLTLENTLIGIGSNALTNVAQEFLFRKLTPKLPHDEPPQPPATRN
jgi:hypothetical protein